MTKTAQHYRAIVIGAGQGGPPLAKALAGAGWPVALLERALVGGTCVNYGCTPTKTLVASARTAHVARRAGEFGVEASGVGVDMRRVRQRKDELVENFRQNNESGLREQENLSLLYGHARFTGPKTLALERLDGTLELSADTVIVNVGQRPRLPDLPGLGDVPYLTSTTIMDLERLPGKLLVLGGGYIGVEFAQMFRRFGSEVTVVQRSAQLLPREDEDVSEALRALLEEEGVRVLLDAHAARVSKGDDGLRLELQSGETLTGTDLLLATGRSPNTDDLGLEQAGIEVDAQGYIRVDDGLGTTQPGVYALGDAAGSPAFTHIAYDDFRVLKDRLLGSGAASTSGRLVPYVLYTDPQLGRVGLSEREAREQGVAFELARLPMDKVARALETGETRGFMKVLVEPGGGKLLGVAVLGAEGGELMSALQLAMMGELSARDLRDGIFAHPTLAESFNNLFAKLEPGAP